MTELRLPDLRAVVRTGPRPVFATVSGAHLYGFAGPDTPVEVRGAVCLPLRSVLGLEPPKDSVSIRQISAGVPVEWVAHDIRKVCLLLTRRNGYILEQVYSPLVVWGGEWLTELRQLARGCIIRPLFLHYRGFFHTHRKPLRRPGATVVELLNAYRVALTGIKLLHSGEVEARLPLLLEEFSLERAGELIERQRRGPERIPLGEAELADHDRILSSLDDSLACAYEDSRLPVEPTTGPALNDYLVRVRLELG